MKKQIFVLHLILSVIIFSSCEKEELPSPSTPTPNPATTTPTSKPSFIGCSLQGSMTQIGTLFSSSGNAAVDLATIQELSFLSGSFLVSPIFYFFDDSPYLPTGNAFSTPLLPIGQIAQDGSVVFGLNLLSKQISSSIWGTNVPIIMAHEFSHTVCRKYNVSLVGKQQELFADYCAGCYMYYRNKNFKQTDINAAIQAFCNMGDNQFTDPSHHGTCQSRSTCLQAGYNDCYNAGRQGIVLGLSNVINLGYTFVTTHNLP